RPVVPPLLPIVVAGLCAAGVAGAMIFQAELHAAIDKEIVGAVAAVDVECGGIAMAKRHPDTALGGPSLRADASSASSFKDSSLLLIDLAEEDLVGLEVRPLHTGTRDSEIGSGPARAFLACAVDGGCGLTVHAVLVLEIPGKSAGINAVL